ncbi:MAG: hypothetical protein JXR77_06540 [Lentisphaeria bacterium]|nr:hypothetical protein [Lentisphaeria bacterium]
MNKSVLVLMAVSLGALDPEVGGQGQVPRGRPGREPAPRTPPPLEFLGWEYDRVGYTLSPGEDVALRFRNNRGEAGGLRVSWRLTTYVGAELARGRTDLALSAGATGLVPVTVPADLADGAYWVRYALDGTGPGGREQLFHFDFRRPLPDPVLNLNLVALVDNMDAEGWTRMVLGPLAPYANVWSNWPKPGERIDAVLVIGETMAPGDPRLARLREYVQQGGRALVFGKPPASFADLLPVRLDPGGAWRETPARVRFTAGGPWQDFDPDGGTSRYGVRVAAKPDATVLAVWQDGAPAVVSGRFGEGTVVHVGSGSGQEWQRRRALEGADELALRLLYWLVRGEGAVTAMLARAEELQSQESAARMAVRDRVLAGSGIAAPAEFVVVSRHNVGRFGWLVEEGGLVENLSAGGVVSGPRTRDFRFGGSQPVVNVGALRSTGAEASYAFAVAGDASPRPGVVEQNWLAKSVTWHYGNGATVRSTLSLGSPGLLWEGEAASVRFTYTSATHLAYASPAGIRVAEPGAGIAGADLAEGWLLAFTARGDVRDMPQLFVLTRRPQVVRFSEGIGLEYGPDGFGALASSRLWGVRRLAPGATVLWPRGVPENALEAARRWSRVLLRYPVDCDEIGWIEGGTVVLADSYRYRELTSDWGTEPLVLAPLPPVLSLAKTVGAPVELPEDRVDLDCPTNCGALAAVPGERVRVRLAMPPRDHRALVSLAGGLAVQESIDQRLTGLGLGQLRSPSGRNEGAGNLHADLEPYDRSGSVPFNEAPCIDVYKWWYTFNALLSRPVYSAPMRERVDAHFRTRYWETLNFYPHKCFVQQKREPWTGVEYLISFVWPVQTQYGYRNYNDANEASGINAYCFANYARYYGDWVTLRANWNLCRRLYEYLPRVNDWAVMASGALEYWRVAGLDMLNSEPYGGLAFAYAAAQTGHGEDELTGLVLGARALVPAVARFGLAEYLRSVSAEGDAWREFGGHYWFVEDGFQLSRRMLGSIGMHDTSKGTFHEQSLAYKQWAPAAIRAHEEALEAAGQNSLPDLTQRLFLGWDVTGLLARVKTSELRQPPNWQSTKDLYDFAVVCLGDTPLFLSEWAPAEYVEGQYDPALKALAVTFRSHEGEPFTVRLYSQREPVAIDLNGQAWPQAHDSWRYDRASGWLTLSLAGNDRKDLSIRFGEPAAPLHPYFGQATP